VITIILTLQHQFHILSTTSITFCAANFLWPIVYFQKYNRSKTRSLFVCVCVLTMVDQITTITRRDL